jgi:hypothetical protein
VALVDRDMRTRMWNEMNYRIEIWRIIKGFSLYRRKNYRDPLRSLFVANF